MSELIKHWSLSKEGEEKTDRIVRNPRRTDLDSYKRRMSDKMAHLHVDGDIYHEIELQTAVKNLYSRL